MGTDFFLRAGKSLKRSWDRGRAEMAAPNLTTRELVSGSRGMPANMMKDAKIVAGEAVTLEVDGGAVVVRRCLAIVARNDSPSPAILEAVARHYNILPGTISVVHDLAGMVEITLSC